MTNSRPWLAWLALAAAGAATVAFEPSAWQVVLAAAATIIFARDPRLGPLPAAMLVVLALPYDRAANNDLLRIAGYPLRPQDVAIGLGILLALPLLRRPSVSVPLVAIGVFLCVGVGALVHGYAADFPLRDVLRDSRWWFLYAAGLVALASRVQRSQVLRALVWGSASFAILAVATTILPPFAGGLKERALIYDSGILRMQFGNTAFLLPALALALWLLLRRPSMRSGTLFLLLGVAAVLSLTRTFMIVVVLVIVAMLVAETVIRRQRGGALRNLAAVGLVLFALAGGVGFNLARSLEGRFATYARAVEVVQAAPLVGHGLGTLVRAPYDFGGEQFATPGWLPNVDNAYLTVGMKAGALGIAAFGAMLLTPALAFLPKRRLRRLAPWLLPAWAGVLLLTLTQSFATTGYSPFALSFLLALGSIGYASSKTVHARPQV